MCVDDAGATANQMDSAETGFIDTVKRVIARPNVTWDAINGSFGSQGRMGWDRPWGKSFASPGDSHLGQL